MSVIYSNMTEDDKRECEERIAVILKTAEDIEEEENSDNIEDEDGDNKETETNLYAGANFFDYEEVPV